MIIGILRLLALLVFSYGVVRGSRAAQNFAVTGRANALTGRELGLMCAAMGFVLLIGVLFQHYHG